ncbi:hypothetical protein V1524DRAFT_410356 [Lipomyces starkeyi]
MPSKAIVRRHWNEQRYVSSHLDDFVLITNKPGIGLGLATQFSKRGDTVIATVRSKGKAAGSSLAKLPNVTLFELDADNLATIDSAVAEINKN